jgi:MFS family permease
MSKLGDFVSKSVYGNDVTPLPPITLTITFLLMSFDAMATTMVFPFLPKMVKKFGATESQAGYYVGIIGSSLFLASLIFSMVWGYLADIFGKKVTAIVSGFGLSVATFVFGFSTTITSATIMRFLQGCFMGNVVITKAILADLCDDTNMSVAMSIIMTAYAIGLILGPAIGGYLAFPAEQYPNIFTKESIFSRFGIFLPSLVVALGIAIFVSLAIKFLPSDKEKPYKEYQSVSNKDLLEDTVEDIEDEEGYKKLNDEPECESSATKLSFVARIKTFKYYKVLTQKGCLHCALLYCCFSMLDIGFAEVFSLLAASDVKYHGMGFTTAQIGAVLMIVSIILTVLQLTFMPRIVRYFGPKKTLVGSTFILTFLYPLICLIAESKSKVTLWACLIIFLIVNRGVTFAVIVSFIILINNSVDSEYLSIVNGLAQTSSSFGRMLAPISAGSIFAWSLTNIKGLQDNKHPLGFPFNQFFVFFFFSVGTLIIALVSLLIPASLNNKKLNEGDKLPLAPNIDQTESSDCVGK